MCHTSSFQHCESDIWDMCVHMNIQGVVSRMSLMRKMMKSHHNSTTMFKNLDSRTSSHHDQMFSQIMTGIQELLQGFNNLKIDIHNILDDLQKDMQTRFNRVHHKINCVERTIYNFCHNFQ